MLTIYFILCLKKKKSKHDRYMYRKASKRPVFSFDKFITSLLNNFKLGNHFRSGIVQVKIAFLLYFKQKISIHNRKLVEKLENLTKNRLSSLTDI